MSTRIKKIIFFTIASVLLIIITGSIIHVFYHDDVPLSDIYVSPDGFDDNSGGEKDPLRSISEALQRVKAGQTIYVMDGIYEEKLEFDRSGSEKEGYIKLCAFPGDEPKLTLPEGEEGAVINLCSCAYITISDFDIGNICGEDVYGILMTGGEKNIIISHNNIHDIETVLPDGEGEANAVLLFGETEKSIKNVEIIDNYIHDNINGWSENISVAGNCEHISVTGNRICNCTNIGIDCCGNAGYCANPAKDHPRNCIISGNEVYNCVSPYAECAGIYIDGAQDVEICDNESYLNAYGIEVGSEVAPKTTDGIVKNISIHNNYVHDNKCTGLIIGGYTPTDETGTVKTVTVFDNEFADNVTEENADNGEICFEKCEDVEVYSNSFYKSENYAYIGVMIDEGCVTHISFHDNVYYGHVPEKEIFFIVPAEEENMCITGIENFNNLEWVNGEKYELNSK